jgi:hypothetical protein
MRRTTDCGRVGGRPSCTPRRLCHYYFPGTLRSACGTASRQPAEGHDEGECAARGHTICVVCTEIWEGVYPR